MSQQTPSTFSYTVTNSQGEGIALHKSQAMQDSEPYQQHSSSQLSTLMN